MSQIISSCFTCGKKYEDWSCDFCYTKYVINKVDSNVTKT